MGGAGRRGKGVRTETRSRHRQRMVSEYTSFRPPSQVGMKMVEGPWFFSSFGGGWSFAAVGDGETLVTWRDAFSTRPAWLSPVVDRIGHWYLGRDIERRLESFAEACSRPQLVAAAHRQPSTECSDNQH